MGEENGDTRISVGVWTWTRVFGPLVGHGNSNNVEWPHFVSPDTGIEDLEIIDYH